MNYRNLQQNNSSSSAQMCRRGLGVLLSILCVCVSAAQAADHTATASTAIQVVTSMAFEDKKATGMSIQQAGGKSYLYVQLADDGGVAVIDVSKPNKPKAVSSMPSFQGGNHFHIDGNAATMTAEQCDALSSPTSSGELVLWDVSDPKKPRVVQRFSDVLRVLQDDRHYTYILNRDRLWVVKDKRRSTNNDSNDSLDASLYGG